MAAPSIPNLATLRGRGGGLRGRARGRGQSTEDDEASQARFRDQTIQQTDNDAASSRMSAVSLGYLEDPYAQAFAPFPPPRRYPLINRGTYVRTTAIDCLIKIFLQTDYGSPKQIISLGAGSDTRFFRLHQVENLIYHELDFADNTSTKISKIKNSQVLKNTLKDPHEHGDGFEVTVFRDCLYSKKLNIHALDLRTLVDHPTEQPPLRNLNPDIPTLILSECCLTYLTLDASNQILKYILYKWLTPATPVGVVLYEPIKPLDAFGKTMSSNLASRNIEMPSLKALPTLQCHRKRLQNISTFKAGARTVYDIYAGEVRPAEQLYEEIMSIPKSTLNRYQHPRIRFSLGSTGCQQCNGDHRQKHCPNPLCQSCGGPHRECTISRCEVCGQVHGDGNCTIGGCAACGEIHPLYKCKLQEDFTSAYRRNNQHSEQFKNAIKQGKREKSHRRQEEARTFLRSNPDRALPAADREQVDRPTGPLVPCTGGDNPELDKLMEGPCKICGGLHWRKVCPNRAALKRKQNDSVEKTASAAGETKGPRNIPQLDGASDEPIGTTSGDTTTTPIESDADDLIDLRTPPRPTPSPNFNFWSPPSATPSPSTAPAGSAENLDYSEMWIPPAERERVEKLEWLDEIEEWQLLASHYCVVWGWRDGAALDETAEVFDRAWTGIGGHWQEKERKDDELHSEVRRKDAAPVPKRDVVMVPRPRLYEDDEEERKRLERIRKK
ncbi:S-adenosyl-L-methionine-dependent methyltransferase [Elsinoe ampelina]|uniref:Leucine carboxyl methyltransferase 1 n=1 Tax=Elsinoe ampelina TaxID=302913 RepID=A0A6A6FYV5_9PEZI|nr:S-adenosyl-L-methionine-dependent methyltransferase [Elsinoe ampelina]